MFVFNSDKIPDSLANNLGRVDEVIEDGGVHGLQSPGPGRKCQNLVFNKNHLFKLVSQLGRSVKNDHQFV